MAMAEAKTLADLATWAGGPPHEVFDQLRAESPVVWVPGDWGTYISGGYWAVLGHAEVVEASRDTGRFTSSKGGSYPTFEQNLANNRGNMMLQDPPEHARLRTMAGRSFSPRVVAQFDTWVRAITRECLDHVATLDEFDFVDEVAAVIPARVIAAVMGVPDDEHHRLVEWAKDVFDRDNPDGGIERAGAAMAEMYEYAEELRGRKRREPAADVITELVNAEFDGLPITDREYQEYVMLLLSAGYETTHTLIGQSVRMLLEDPGIHDATRVAIERGQAKNANEEFLRLITPPMNMARFTTGSCQLGGVDLEADQMVVMWFVAANRDPLVFEDPHRFISERSPNNHLAFGAPGSPHYCLGHALGRLEGRILLEELLADDLPFRLAGQPRLGGGVFINALQSLPVEKAR